MDGDGRYGFTFSIFKFSALMDKFKTPVNVAVANGNLALLNRLMEFPDFNLAIGVSVYQFFKDISRITIIMLHICSM